MTEVDAKALECTLEVCIGRDVDPIPDNEAGGLPGAGAGAGADAAAAVSEVVAAPVEAVAAPAPGPARGGGGCESVKLGLPKMGIGGTVGIGTFLAWTALSAPDPDPDSTAVLPT